MGKNMRKACAYILLSTMCIQPTYATSQGLNQGGQVEVLSGEEKEVQTNSLLVNPGFEETQETADSLWIGNEKVSGWEARPFSTSYNVPAFQVETQGENNLVKIEAKQDNTRGFLVQTVPIKGGNTYTIEVKMKTENITGNNFAVQTIQKNSKGTAIDGTNTSHVLIDGTKDWQTYSVTFDTAADATQLEFRLILGATYRVNSGSVWVDDVILQEQEKRGTNLAKGKKTSASSFWSSTYNSELAVDGDKTTRWAAKDKANQWYEIDFGKEVTFNTLLIDEYTNPGEASRLTQYSFQYWDGEKWINFCEGKDGVQPIYNFDEVTTQKLRIDMPISSNPPTFYEVEVYDAVIESLSFPEDKVIGKVGEQYTLSPIINPEYAAHLPLKWSSSNVDVADVDEKGQVTFYQPGTSEVTVATLDNQKTATYTVEVVEAIQIESIDLKEEVRLLQNEQLKLMPSIKPEGVVNIPLTWESSNTQYVTVNEEGVIKGVGLGEAEITVTEPGGVKATCKVTVSAPANNIIPNGNFEQNVGGEPAQMKITSTGVKPTVVVDNSESYMGNNALKISTEGPTQVEIAPSNNNLVAKDSEIYRLSVRIKGSEEAVGNLKFKYTHKKGGRTALTTTSKDLNIQDGWQELEIIHDPMQSTNGQSTYLVLDLQKGDVWIDEWRLEKLERHNTLELPETVNLDVSEGIRETELTLTKDEGLTKDERLLWITSDESIVEVVDGKLKAKKAGTATISVMTLDRIVRDTCEVIVTGEVPLDQRIPVETIQLAHQELSIEAGTTTYLAAEALPVAAYETNLEWTSSNPEVATVIDGRVMGVAAGTTTITAKASNGITNHCEVTVTPQQIDDFDKMIEAWVTKSTHKVTDEILQQAIEAWETMDKNDSRKGLWYEPTVTVPRVWQSDKINADATKLRRMAIVATMEGSPLKGNQELIHDTVEGMMWLYENSFGPNNLMGYTWWQWEIGIPQIVNDIFAMMQPYFTQEEINATMGFIHNDLMPHPEYMEYWPGGRLPNTGANLTDQVKVALVPAMFMKDGTKIETCKSLVLETLKYVKTGDGFYEDGSFIQHGDIAYTGSYGAVYLGGVTTILDIFTDTDYVVSGEQAERLYKIVQDSYLPLLYKGPIMDMVNGRAIVRKNLNDHRGGPHDIVTNSIRLAYGAPEPYRSNILAQCKYLIQADPLCDYTVGTSKYIAATISKLLEDESIQPQVPTGMHKEYGGMNRTVHHEKDFSVGISKSSNRIKTYEVTNYENQKGWHTGDGMMYLYNNDLNHYEDTYWVTVDWDKLPGTTADPYRERNWGTQSSGDAQGRPKNTWAGGVEFQNKFGSSGMNLQTLGGKTATDLTANKSWFMFDDAIIAIGSGINNTNDRTIETTVEQRRIQGNNTLIVDGITQDNTLGWEQDLQDVSWAHLAGNNPGADIGYYFPNTTDIKAKRMTQTGTYHEIMKNNDHTVYESNFLTMWLDHGTNPVDEKYAYAILPGATPEEMAAYSQNPSFEILAQEETLHAVKHLEHNIIAANFYGKDPQAVAFIQADGEAAVMVEETEDTLSVALSDPTMTREQIVVELKGKNYVEVISQEEGILVEQLADGIRITVDTKGALSKTFEVQLATREVGPGVVAKVDSEVYVGTPLEMQVSIQEATEPVYAQDMTIEYDADLFELSHIEAIDPTMLVEKVESEGRVRILLATDKGLKPGEEALKVTFMPKRVTTAQSGDITIDAVKWGVVGEDAQSSTLLATGTTKTVQVKPNQVVIDKAELQSTIQEAEKLSQEAVIGDQVGQYPEVAKKALDQAILSAQQVAATSESQVEVDAAVQDLRTAIQAFKESQIKGAAEDINQDGVINVADLALVAYYYQADLTTNEAARAADVNQDGKVDIIDLSIVASEILKK